MSKAAKPVKAVHPGEILRTELEARKIVTKEFAKTLGVSWSHLNYIMQGKRNITLTMAQKLGDILGTGPEVWNNMQKSFSEQHNGFMFE